MRISRRHPDEEPVIFPRPRSVTRSAGTCHVAPGDSTLVVKVRRDEMDGPGHYSVRIAESVKITCADAEGELAARATLHQLHMQYGDTWPRLEIHDGPEFATRGVMLDVSRCRIPAMREFFEIIDLLASLKFNHLQLYTEHTFAYAGHEDVWRGWSPLTPSEIQRLDTYCQSKGIALVANQNCFGHLAHWLKMPRYQHLAETHGDWMFDVWPRSGPFSLCPTDERSVEFVRDLLTQLCPHFSSPIVNIGCDETYDVGFGRSRDAVQAKGRHAVYAEFVSKVCDLTRRLNRRPAFWADIALHDPDTLDRLPQDLIALCWGYEPDSQFYEWEKECNSRGMETWVCPGTSSWCSITGRSTESLENIRRAVEPSHGATADGFLITDWGDRGHHQTWPISLLGIARAAQAAWNPESLLHPDLNAGISEWTYGDASGGIAGLVQEIGDIDYPIRQIAGKLTRPNDPKPAPRLLNQSALFADLWKPWEAGAEIAPVAMWHEAAERLHDCRVKLGKSNASALIRDELGHTLDCATLALTRATLRRKANATSGEIAALMPQLQHIMQEHARLWPIRSRSGGLNQSLEFYRTIGKTLVPR